MSLQGEDKAMKRYRSLNMNGDVVAKVCIVKLHVASVASFLVKHINIIINIIIILITVCMCLCGLAPCCFD